MKNEILKVLHARYSPVAFDSRPIPADVMSMLFEAARVAPSSYNDQPWQFYWGQKSEDGIYEMLFDALVPANQAWAKTAPVLMLSAAEKISPTSGNENPFAMYDTGMAVANMLAQATYLGLFVHQMGGFDKQKVLTALKLPENVAPLAIMAVGYKGDVNQLPGELHARDSHKGIRKPVDSFVIRR